MGLVRNYLMLSGVQVTVPQDHRSRSDFYVYNEENVKAETAMEMFAFDRAGKLIMKPTTSDYEAEYNEKYIFWAGPFETTKRVQKGEGLLEDFTDLVGE